MHWPCLPTGLARTFSAATFHRRGSWPIRYPTFDGIAVDPQNGLVVMSDENRSGLFMYDRASGSSSPNITEPKRHIIGPRTDLGFIAGVTLDPKNREAWVVNNDGGGVDVFSYDLMAT